jgi:2-polyprenyl-6-methoxyphenol hydroxylase-like FAD-dependent oxidoreductase
MKNQKILVCGAGIAGPCIAPWLLRYGFEPVLVERAPALRTGGYVVDFWAGAYILAGEIARADGDHAVAFPAYERLLQPLMARKQRAAASFARSFVPRTELGILYATT